MLVFTVTNLGSGWPRRGDINIYQTDDGTMVNKHHLKLDTAQQATFNVHKLGMALAGEIGVWIQPSWKDRPLQYDAKITCRS